MAGDPTNARIWAYADVYVSFDLDAVGPATIASDWPVAWELVGLLDGDQGFVEQRNEEETDHSAWGAGIYAVTRRNYKETKAFTAIEHNDTTFRLQRPGSTATELVVPKPERLKIGFEVRNGSGAVERRWSSFQAEVKVNGDINETEAAPTTLPFIATVFPGPANEDGLYPLWVRQLAEAS